eukprot:9237660-Pyramimonas_sp.AAC.1
MQGPWNPISKLIKRGAANESGQGCTEEARMQWYPGEDCPSLPCGLIVYPYPPPVEATPRDPRG